MGGGRIPRFFYGSSCGFLRWCFLLIKSVHTPPKMKIMKPTMNMPSLLLANIETNPATAAAIK